MYRRICSYISRKFRRSRKTPKTPESSIHQISQIPKPNELNSIPQITSLTNELTQQAPNNLESKGLSLIPQTTFLSLPNELIYQITDSLKLEDLNSLLRANKTLKAILSPELLKRAVKTTLRSDKRSVLHWASIRNRTSLATLLLKAGAQSCINDRDCHELTALHSVSILGNVNMVELLLENGADTELRTGDGWTSLHCAAISGSHQVVRVLLEKGADVRSRVEFPFRYTSLHFAAAYGHVAVVEVLVEMGGRIRDRDSLGLTALGTAVAARQQETIGQLLRFTGTDSVPWVSFMDCFYSNMGMSSCIGHLDFYFSFGNFPIKNISA